LDAKFLLHIPKQSIVSLLKLAIKAGGWGGSEPLPPHKNEEKQSIDPYSLLCTLFAPAKTEGMMAHVHEAPKLTPASDMNSLDQVSSGKALQNDITLVKVTIPITSPTISRTPAAAQIWQSITP
jgi:hypothetical protein